MRLSILDQVPLTEHAPTRSEALASGLSLAQDADELGYHRIWFAEHHNSQSFASAAPEMMTALALERTAKIRIGTGAILLPYYSAQKVTEAMGLLSAVHPDRVDTGVGRASLSDPNYAAKIASLVRELDATHAPSNSEPAGRVWVLGAGGSTAPLPGTLGAGYVHGHFLRPTGGEVATSAYREAALGSGHTPHTVLAVRFVTAETEEKAHALAEALLLWRVLKDFGHDGPIPSTATAASYQWSTQERARAVERSAALIVGTPAKVRAELLALAKSHQADELMLNTLVNDPEDRLNAYRLLAEALID
ncbi:LLM class flavin-dependent oxidoreductase [Arthrobacter sp. MYb213]|uniref:LLM class flavin-dependent oxidoreductase n=1 Tax=Arthrobacter sp. MYb213 TaxID=1848595 RepID=UPI000CFDAA9C|nr:LLM class flavin-dependent oxidoreductase [Arthrobacter sp. MYb213]PRB70336.1 LLM class flavin-dependent oxidoreductase [Arthrobacter sp. MYb213]